jgi:hypothetical protein
MKIGKKQQEENRLVRLTWVVLLLVVFAVGIILGQNNIVQSAQSLLSDADQVFDFGNGDGRLPTLIIDMPFARYNDTILRQRDEAIETGIYFGPEEDFANADIQWTESRFRCGCGCARGRRPILVKMKSGTWRFARETAVSSLACSAFTSSTPPTITGSTNGL